MCGSFYSFRREGKRCSKRSYYRRCRWSSLICSIMIFNLIFCHIYYNCCISIFHEKASKYCALMVVFSFQHYHLNLRYISKSFHSTSLRDALFKPFTSIHVLFSALSHIPDIARNFQSLCLFLSLTLSFISFLIFSLLPIFFHWLIQTPCPRKIKMLLEKSIFLLFLLGW